MKKLLLPILLVLVMAIPSFGATIIIKVSQFPNTSNPAGTDLFLLASGATNKNITWNQLIAAIGTNPASITITTNLYVTNAYFNEFRGRVEYIENSYITNLNVNYITNNVSYITNLYSSNAYITNLFLTELTTNYFLFSTNIYQSYPTYVNNTYISNYFQTNAFLNTYVSNYFNTNQFNYYTNIYHYSTNLTVTNFYLTDTYISNFFNTNIFVVDNTVSNFFATNIYNTINISSNYTYQYDINPTNLVMYGHTFMLGYNGDPNPTLILTGQTNEIYLDGGLGNIVTWGQVYGNSFQPKEVDWVGPTNSISHYASDYFYTTYTPVSLTGFTEAVLLDPTHSWGGLLTITNAASTNVLWTLPAGLTIPERTNQVAISNASRGMLSIKRSHKSGTNGVYRQF